MPTYQQLSLVVVPGGGVEGPAAVAQNESILYLDAGHGKNIKEILEGSSNCRRPINTAKIRLWGRLV